MLPSCEIDDGMVAGIAARLRDDATITKLGLAGNLVSDEGAAQLARLIDRNATLQQLDLQRNSIGQPGLRALAQVMRSNTTLWQLDFAKTNLAMRAKAERKLIHAECIINRDIVELLRQQRSWEAKGGMGFVLELLSLLEECLIRADIKLCGSLPEETKDRVLEMQLCLSNARV
jgi:hypothetical protein